MQAVLFYGENTETTRSLTLVDQASWQQLVRDGRAPEAALSQGFSGKVGELFYGKTIWVGAGERDVVSAVAVAAQKLPEGTYAFDKPLEREALLAWSLSQYRFDKYKKNSGVIRRLCLPACDKEAVLNWAESIFLVRDLINTPAQDMDPAVLAEETRVLGALFQAEVRVCDNEQLLQEGYRAIHAVGRAASVSPRLIQLEWGEAHHPLVVLLGKGVCFDSGGLDLKSSSNMRLMKKDMGGAAQVLGLARWIMATRLPIRLVVLIPAVENSVSAGAYRPGDVLTMRNGLTVEIENTDAEGRLVLADAFTKACEMNPSIMLDFSTLTGAARVAVGTEISAMFSNHQQLANDLLASSQEVNDPLWQLPLFEHYASMLDSSIADLLNASSSSYAGAITAALFLERFVKPDIPWVHFDMMAWNVSNKPGKPEGGEAMAIRAVGHYLEKRFKKSCG